MSNIFEINTFPKLFYRNVLEYSKKSKTAVTQPDISDPSGS